MAGEMSSQPLTAGMKMVVIGVMVAATNALFPFARPWRWWDSD